jgi:ABC-type glutathione transport system ATPase component
MYLTVRNATKTYGTFTALDDVSISIEQGEFVCLLGPSGCGKTTLLRLIAGLTDLDAGEILLEDEPLSALPARKRGFGIVFQSYSLFPGRRHRGPRSRTSGPHQAAAPGRKAPRATVGRPAAAHRARACHRGGPARSAVG